MNEQYKGRVALVTGASSGIGRATALALAKDGLRVAMCARRVDQLPDLGQQGLSLHCDLRDETQILEMFSQIRSTWGGVDVLVNNAGLGHIANLTDGQTHKWREMLEVNVLALSICTREVLQSMRERGVDDGHIVHISSMSAHRTPAGSGMYSATKFAVRALTEGLRMELREAKSAIRVTSVSPGNVETEFAEKLLGSREKAAESYTRMRCLTAEDVAETVRWALAAPPRMQIHDILLRPTEQVT